MLIYDLLLKGQVGKYSALSLEFIILQGIYTVSVVQLLCRRLLPDVNCK